MVVHIRADEVSHEARHPGNPLGDTRCALTRPDKPVLRGARTPRFRGGYPGSEGVSPSCALSQTLIVAQIWFVPKEASAPLSGMCRAPQHGTDLHIS